MGNVRIENWAVVANRAEIDRTGQPPIRIRGFVTGHPHCVDGTEITTSPITHRQEECYITSNGTHYELGRVAPEYDARFPKAKEGLLQCIPERNGDETIVMVRPRQPGS